jgi:mRNA-degrading endonuclease toxin of MazEF toxin-antitoxin module
MIHQGETYLADFEQAGQHRVIVVLREALNRGKYALVVLCTSTHFAVRMNLANCVPFRAGEFGFTSDCVAQCENMLAISVSQLDLAAGPIATLDATALRSVVKAIGDVIDSDCDPNLSTHFFPQVKITTSFASCFSSGMEPME